MDGNSDPSTTLSTSNAIARHSTFAERSVPTLPAIPTSRIADALSGQDPDRAYSYIDRI